MDNKPIFESLFEARQARRKRIKEFEDKYGKDATVLFELWPRIKELRGINPPPGWNPEKKNPRYFEPDPITGRVEEWENRNEDYI